MAELDSRFRSVTLPGVDSASATTTMLQVLADGSGLRVDRIGPGRLSVSRTVRPRWATVAAVALCWVGGLGLLFLLVRRTEAQEALVVDAPRGCVVTIPPLVGPALRVRLEEALAALRRQPATVGAPAWERIGTHDGLDDRTVTRIDGGAVGPAGLVLQFGGGTVVIDAGESVVLGRDPVADEGRAVTVPGDSSTVSKSHLRVSWDGVVATVTDHHSTNGSSIDDGSGPTPLEPGVDTAFVPGTILALGATTCSTEVRPRSAP